MSARRAGPRRRSGRAGSRPRRRAPRRSAARTGSRAGRRSARRACAGRPSRRRGGGPGAGRRRSREPRPRTGRTGAGASPTWPRSAGGRAGRRRRQRSPLLAPPDLLAEHLLDLGAGQVAGQRQDLGERVRERLLEHRGPAHVCRRLMHPCALGEEQVEAGLERTVGRECARRASRTRSKCWWAAAVKRSSRSSKWTYTDRRETPARLGRPARAVGRRLPSSSSESSASTTASRVRAARAERPSVRLVAATDANDIVLSLGVQSWPPQRRKAGRGRGDMAEGTWDPAFDEVVTILEAQVTESGGGAAVCVYHGGRPVVEQRGPASPTRPGRRGRTTPLPCRTRRPRE